MRDGWHAAGSGEPGLYRLLAGKRGNAMLDGDVQQAHTFWASTSIWVRRLRSTSPAPRQMALLGWPFES